ncbi:MAG: DUF1549 and DUF1553 domain-containing protein [Planctomycetota bacterium]
MSPHQFGRFWLFSLAWILAITFKPTPSALAQPAIPIEQAQAEHWAFQPIQKPLSPDPDTNPIDAHIATQLAEHGLKPSQPADRRTLIRRAYFDLIGIPPTYRQVESFVHDKNPDAFARVIDELLASPLYGERWGRHWLDVARYADTRGYLTANLSRDYPFAFTYRDYVIRAFNDDKPYDRFILEQLAADQLDDLDSPESLAAMGFLTVGRRFINRIDEIIDDRIDVVTRGLMGMTVGCARCHDHKTEPVAAEDYYALYGIFRSSVEPATNGELPVIAEPEPSPEYNAYKAEFEKRLQAVEDHLTEQRKSITHELRTTIADYLVYYVKTHPNHTTGKVLLTTDRGVLRKRGNAHWQFYFNLQFKQADHAVWAPFQSLLALKKEDFSTRAPETLAALTEQADNGSTPLNPIVLDALQEASLNTMTDVAQVYGDLLEDFYARFTPEQEGGAKKNYVDASPEQKQLLEVIFTNNTPTNLLENEELVHGFFTQAERNRLRGLQKKVEDLHSTSPGAPPRAMVINEASRMFDPYVYLRGKPGNRGPSVPRRFLEVLSHVDGRTYDETSGRLELAHAIASPKNPLTPRVLVNRVWMHHFGQGIVDSPSDFGYQGMTPTHPELLDYLATTFMEDGWSIKSLHRRIMLSAAYQQASDDRERAMTIDPENRLIWKMNRRRLEFEPMRDAMLKVAGRLDTTPGGRPVDLETRPFSTRRSVYGKIDRQDLPNMLRAFDFANPDASSPHRPHTTVPQQALYMLNAPFVAEQAKHLAEAIVTKGREPEENIRNLFRKAYSRDPNPHEAQLGLRFVQNSDNAWPLYAQALLLANEFVFID